MTRKRVLAAGVIGVVLLVSAAAWAQAPVTGPPPVVPRASAAPSAPADGKSTYRGFTVDVTGIQGVPQYDAIMTSTVHQIDIVADCGAKPEQLRFFRSQVIVMAPPARGEPGHFDSRNPGVSIAGAVAEPQKPILLHELLHAYHFRVMPGAFRNADVLAYFNRARDSGLYPQNAYVLKNVQEFFAVTASLYLWGHVDRPPFTREKLKAAQPVYYAWLGQLFGVAK
jgi:hypothetical protein